jgi:hypothetical protein
MSVSVDAAAAKKNLERAWAMVDDQNIVPPKLAISYIDSILESKDVTFKYILVTGLLGKVTNPAVHPRAIQTSSSLKESYDARSLCHSVIVPFEKTRGDLFGLSNEPFVNKPARHPEHSKDNTQLRNATLAARLHEVLELAHKAKPEEVFAMLVYTLRLGKARAASQVTATVEVETTHQRVVNFVREFLKESDGGSRLAAVVGAFIRLMNEGQTVKVYPPNYSDKFAKTSGDVEIHHAKATISAFECKHRPITIDDVRHGIKKARENGVPEYWFIGAGGLAPGQEKEIEAELRKSGESVDLHLIDVLKVLPTWAALLNPVRRGKFGETVAEILRDDMHRAEVANQAAETWNELE